MSNKIVKIKRNTATESLQATIGHLRECGNACKKLINIHVDAAEEAANLMLKLSEELPELEDVEFRPGIDYLAFLCELTQKYLTEASDDYYQYDETRFSEGFYMCLVGEKPDGTLYSVFAQQNGENGVSFHFAKETDVGVYRLEGREWRYMGGPVVDSDEE